MRVDTCQISFIKRKYLRGILDNIFYHCKKKKLIPMQSIGSHFLLKFNIDKAHDCPWKFGNIIIQQIHNSLSRMCTFVCHLVVKN